MAKYVNELIEYSGIDFCPYDDLVNFKEISLNNTFSLPIGKPNVDEIIKVKSRASITNYQIVQSPNFRIILSGNIVLNYEYSTNNLTQTVHFTTTTIPFSDFIELPQGFNVQAVILPIVSIRYVYCNLIDSTNISNALTLMVSVESC